MCVCVCVSFRLSSLAANPWIAFASWASCEGDCAIGEDEGGCLRLCTLSGLECGWEQPNLAAQGDLSFALPLYSYSRLCVFSDDVSTVARSLVAAFVGRERKTLESGIATK